MSVSKVKVRRKSVSSSSLSSFSSAQISSLMSQEVESFQKEIGGLSNNTRFHRPPELIEWIKGKTDIDNVYLVPSSDERDENYLYEVVTSEQANRSIHWCSQFDMLVCKIPTKQVAELKFCKSSSFIHIYHWSKFQGHSTCQSWDFKGGPPPKMLPLLKNRKMHEGLR